MTIEDRLHMLDIEVTDHAVVRWLERVCGADIFEIRAQIRAALLLGGIPRELFPAGDAAVYIDVPAHSVHLVVRHGQVVTVFEGGLETD